MDYADARYRMIQHQLRTNRVTDTLLIAAMSELPRERFLPEALRGIAYVDEDIPLGGGRWLVEPLGIASMLQAAQIDADDVVLEVGSGVGYGAAVIARMASAVVALEENPELAERASATLRELGLLDTVTVVNGPLRHGYAEQAPYDVIVFSGAVAEVPKSIFEQLAEGGRLVAVVSPEKGMGRGTVFLRRGDSVSSRTVFDAATPRLPGFVPEPTFRF
jgi:protein-L-isoaspartate(D-aspartate) O-methyltransferase